MNPTSPLRQNVPTEYKSALAQAIDVAAEERPCSVYPVSGVFHLGGKPIRKIAIRVNVKSEEDRALLSAHKYVTDFCAGVDSAKTDHDLLSDAKARHALFEACREVKTTVDADGNETDEVTKYPAFPGPQWMAERMTTDQIATIFNLYMQARAEQAGWLENLDDATVDAMCGVAAEADRNPLARVALAQIPRDQLQNLFHRCAVRLRAAMLDVEHLRNQVAPQAEDASGE